MKQNTQKGIFAVTALSVILGGICAAMRILLLQNSYDPIGGIYMHGTLLTAYTAVTVAGILLLAGLAFFLTPKNKDAVKGSATQKVTGVILASVLGVFLFRFASMVKKSTGKVSGLALVVIIFGAISLIASLFDWIPGCEKRRGMRSVLSTAIPVFLLFTVFFFYFEKTTMIHNSAKKLAILTFSAFILAALADVRFDLRAATPNYYSAAAAVGIMLSISYAVPGIIRTLTDGTSFFLDFSFDLLLLAFAVRYAAELLTLTDTKAAESEENAQ